MNRIAIDHGQRTRFWFAKADFFACLILLWSVPLALGQAVPRKPFPKEPLEKLDNPPALAPAVAISPALVSQFGRYTSYQVNVDANGNNIVGDAANEPSICVDPTNGNKMSIGWRQFNSVTSNFRQAGWAYTTNGGTSWSFPGVLENNVFRSDPVLNADSTGNFFYLSLLETFFDNMWRSLNGGMSWTNIAPAMGGDKEWFVIDNTNSTGHGFQYQCWSTDGNNYGGRQFTRSTDGGFTWLNPINIPNAPTWGTLDVDTNGNLFIAGVNQSTGQIWCIRSSNAKNGGVTPSFDQSTLVNLGGDIDSGEPINPGGLVGQLYLAVDRSGVGTNNNIYMLASVLPTGFTTGSDVMFVRSTNGGLTFSAPRRINDDPANHAKWHWFGALSVAPNGRLDVIWLDTRNAANNTDSQLFYSYSMDGGNSWAANVAVSNSFNPFLGYPNQNKMGDYISAVSDNAGANVAYTATFNGEQDIYYVRVTTTPAPTPTTDGNADIIWQNTSTGERLIWIMNGTTIAYGVSLPTEPTSWSIAGTGDFNGDGNADIIWQNTITGQRLIWIMNGTTIAYGVSLPTEPTSWSIAGTGDFNGDGKSDIIWQNTITGQRLIWIMNGTTLAYSVSLPTEPTSWSIAGTGDFNRDGKSDIVWQNTITGQRLIWIMNGTTIAYGVSLPTEPTSWSIAGTGDFNGDGKSDIIWQNTITGQRLIWIMNDTTIAYGVNLPTEPTEWSIAGSGGTVP